jgi:hypothetical protein
MTMSTIPEDNTQASQPAAQEAGVLAKVESFVEGLLHPGTDQPAQQSDPQVTGAEDSKSDESKDADQVTTSEDAKDESPAKREALGKGVTQAGNAMDTMHGKVNSTWPPKAR